jgi:hypothetical protein
MVVRQPYQVRPRQAGQLGAYRLEMDLMAADLVNKASTTVVNPLGPVPDKPPRSKVGLPDHDLQHRDVEGGLLWTVRGSMLLAHDGPGDESHWNKASVAPRFLFKTKQGRYFVVKNDKIRPLKDALPRPAKRPVGTPPRLYGEKLHPDHDRSHSAAVEAARLFESMSEKLVDFKAAFPGLAMVVA